MCRSWVGILNLLSLSARRFFAALQCWQQLRNCHHPFSHSFDQAAAQAIWAPKRKANICCLVVMFCLPAVPRGDRWVEGAWSPLFEPCLSAAWCPSHSCLYLELQRSVWQSRINIKRNWQGQLLAGGETGNLPLRQLSADFQKVLGDMVSQQSNLCRALQGSTGNFWLLLCSHYIVPSIFSPAASFSHLLSWRCMPQA